jgi:hypothetical protein
MERLTNTKYTIINIQCYKSPLVYILIVIALIKQAGEAEAEYPLVLYT